MGGKSARVDELMQELKNILAGHFSMYGTELMMNHIQIRNIKSELETLGLRIVKVDADFEFLIDMVRIADDESSAKLTAADASFLSDIGIMWSGPEEKPVLKSRKKKGRKK